MDLEKIFNDLLEGLKTYKPGSTPEEWLLFLETIKKSPFEATEYIDDNYEFIDIEIEDGKPLRLVVNKPQKDKEE